MINEHLDLTNSIQDLDFLQDDIDENIKYKSSYKIMIADDDNEIHTVTKMILKDFNFEGKNLSFIDTYSGKETMEALKNNQDIAVLFLDVVMEENNSGLFIVDYLRNTLNNNLTRIILRTGQPGEAPEDKVIREYDINDYRLKTELTVQRLNTSLYAALRSYRDITKLERNKRGLEKMIEASSEMFQHNSLSDFLSSILDQVANFYQDDLEMLYVRESEENAPSGFIASNDENEFVVIAANGKYEPLVGKNINDIPELDKIREKIIESDTENNRVTVFDGGFIVKQYSNHLFKNYIFIEGANSKSQIDLINLFLTNYSMALDNIYLNKLTSEIQEEMLYTLGEVIESQFEETSGHVKRVTNLMRLFAQKVGISKTEAEFIKIASSLHDVGKIGIPEKILKKPGKLTDEEMRIMKGHCSIGHKLLSKSRLKVFNMAAEIALHHHEKFDGTGYPHGLKGEEISIYSRMMAIVDVYDAMTHKRIYKDAICHNEVVEYLVSQKDKHFDGKMVDIFLSLFDENPEINESIC